MSVLEAGAAGVQLSGLWDHNPIQRQPNRPDQFSNQKPFPKIPKVTISHARPTSSLEIVASTLEHELAHSVKARDEATAAHVAAEFAKRARAIRSLKLHVLMPYEGSDKALRVEIRSALELAVENRWSELPSEAEAPGEQERPPCEESGAGR